MKPIKLRLKGFTGIKKGLGLDEITLDLSNVQGLIALAGENGRGKSSVLENLTPYRMLFSRSGNLNSHCHLRDSEKEFIFEYQGHVYRTLVKIDAESDRGEGFIWKDGEPQVNGKRKDYDRYINDLLGSAYLFANSVFCPQGSKKLTDMRTGELREMFAEFLRLDKLQEYEATTKQLINVLSFKILTLERRRDTIRESARDQRDVEGDIADINNEMMQVNEELAAAEERLSLFRFLLEEARKTKALNEIHERRREELTQSLDMLKKDLQTMEDKSLDELTVLRAKYRAIEKDIADINKLLEERDQVVAAAGEVKKLEAALAELQDKEANVRGLETALQSDISPLQEAVAQIKMDVAEAQKGDELRTVENELGEGAKEILKINNEIQRLASDSRVTKLEANIQNALEKGKDLDRRDPECQSTTCSFIIGALKAREDVKKWIAEKHDISTKLAQEEVGLRESLGRLKAKREALETEFERLRRDKEKTIDDLNLRLRGIEGTVLTKKKDLARIINELADIRVRIDVTRRKINIEKHLAGLLPEIQAAEAKMEILEKNLADNLAQGKTLRNQWNERIDAKRKEVSEGGIAIMEVNKLIDHEAANGEKKYTELVRFKEVEIKECDERKQALTAKMSSLSAEMTALAKVDADIRSIDAEIGKLNADLSEWSYLRDACSKTGLQALEIDGVCPRIQYIANQLLSDAFGPSFSIRIITQDDEGKEVFQVFVIREDGDETLLDNLSGGQRVWILKAIRLALTVLSKQKSGRAFAAGFADEEDGSLDADNATAFIDLYRAFMREGAMESFYFISHRAACVERADHIIHFGNGGITIN